MSFVRNLPILAFSPVTGALLARNQSRLTEVSPMYSRLIASLLLVMPCFAQFLQMRMPDSAQVYLYFPHLADGGSPAQQWQTKLTFINPNTTSAVVQVNFLQNNGGPLSLDFGGGVSSQISFSLPPGGSQIFQSRIASSSIVEGWAYATASLPVQGIVTFREIVNGTSQTELSADSTLPTTGYFSAANPALGIAVANPFTNIPVSVVVSAYDSQGRAVGQTTVTVPPLGHTAFNLYQMIAGLPANFTGMVYMYGSTPQDRFVAWTLAAGTGTLSTLPDGRLGLPVSHWERIWLVFSRVLSAVSSAVNLGQQPVNLTISPDQAVNAFGNANGIQINLALAELISDSPSELAFVIGHELGHVYQFRNKTFFLPALFSDIEFDADAFGEFAALSAGYDAYAAAGALAKLAMATGTADLTSQFEAQNSADAHKSFNNRIESVFLTISAACGLNATTQGICTEYKSIMHPHLPAIAPLIVEGRPPENGATK